TEEEFRALLETIAETDAAEAARIRVDNLKGSIVILGCVIEAIKLRTGDVFVPCVREVVEGITGFLEANEENIVGFFENIMTIFEGFISGTPTDIPWDTMFPPAIAARLMDLSELVEDLGDIIRGVFDGTVDLNSKWEELLPPWAVDTAYRIADAIRFIQEKADTLAGALLGGLAGAGIAAALGAIS